MVHSTDSNLTSPSSFQGELTPASQRFPTTGADVAIGDVVSGAAVLTERTDKMTRANKPMAQLMLRNNTGVVAVPVWAESLAEIGKCVAGMPVLLTCERVHGRDGSPEWRFIAAIPLPPAHPVMREALPQAPVSQAALTARTSALKAALSPDACKLFDVILNTPVQWPDGSLAPMRGRFLEAPAAVSYHHACLSGLWWHSVQTSEIALASAVALQRTDAPDIYIDAVILGGVFHDIGKLDELNWNGVFSYAPRGAIASHMGWGMSRVTEAITRAQVSDDWRPSRRQRNLIDHTLLVISSHHGQKDFGALVEPASRESWAVSTADMLSSRVQPITDLASTGQALGDGWSRVGTGWKQRLQLISENADAQAALVEDAPASTGLRLTLPIRTKEVRDAE